MDTPEVNPATLPLPLLRLQEDKILPSLYPFTKSKIGKQKAPPNAARLGVHSFNVALQIF